MFTTDTGAPMFPDSLTQWFSGFIARSGMPKVTVHSLRPSSSSKSLVPQRLQGFSYFSNGPRISGLASI